MGRDFIAGQRAGALHVFVLWGFAVAQPLFDLLGRQAQLFVAHDLHSAHVVALALVLTFLFPALLVLGEVAVGLAAPSAGRAVHWLLLALLTAATMWQLLRRLDRPPGGLLVAAALVAGAAAAWACQRFSAIRSYLTILAPAPLIFAGAFLFSSQASKLVWSEPRTVPLPAIDADVPVVLMVFDELSLPTLMDGKHRIDALRYPNFAALAGAGHWFRNATATSDVTVLALPALLTGRYLGKGHREARLATAVNYPANLFTLLGGSYRLNVLEHVTALCPSEICPPKAPDLSPARRMRTLLSDLAAVYLQRVLPADLAVGLPQVDQQWAHFGFLIGDSEPRGTSSRRGSDGSRVRSFFDFQAAIRAESGSHGGTVALHFLHSGLPHVPWRYLPSGRHYGTRRSRLIKKGPSFRKGRWVEDRWPVLLGFQRYLLQQQFADRLLGEVLATLEEVGLYDRALVIVTADHGVSFQPGSSRRAVDRHNFADIMSVPLFVKLPRQREGAVSDRNVELIDILPTIIEVLGLEEPWPMDGSSVFDAASERSEKRFFTSHRQRMLTFDPAAMDARYETVERMVEAFGPSSDPLALYRIGPYADLIGRPLSQLEVEVEPRRQVRLRTSELYQDVDPATGFVPARVIGSIRLQEPEEGPLELAVTVGGTVWATTRTLETATPRAAFTAVVPEQAFVPGRNRVEVLVISGTPERPRLIPTLRATS